MIWFGNEINNDYAWEVYLLHKYREFSDGIEFFNFNINWDRYLADHRPQFVIKLVLCNFVLLEFSIYYKHHRNEEVTNEQL
jgi:hypothetical protein